MLQVKTSPRSKNFHHSFITTTCPNLSEYFLETNQTSNSKKQKKEDIHPYKKSLHIPVLKNFHQVIYRNHGEERKNVNSIRSFSQEKTESGESFETREIITDFRRSPKQNFDDINCLSTKATPRLDQDNEQAQLKDSKSLSELLSILQSKELEIRKLRQTNANLEKNVNQFSLIKEEYDKTDLKQSLEKYDKIIGVYSELLRKLSKHIPNEIKHSNRGLEEVETFHKTFPASSQSREKRSSIDAHIKSVSDIYFNETPTGESLGTTKISTGQNMSLYCKLYEKVHSNASLSRFDKVEGNVSERTTRSTIIDSMPNSVRGTGRKKFVLKKYQSDSKTRFNLVLQKDFPSECQTERNSNLKVHFTKRKYNNDRGSSVKERISSIENTTDTSKKEKSVLIKHDLVDFIEKLKKAFESYQLKRNKLIKQTEMLREKIEKLQSIKKKS